MRSHALMVAREHHGLLNPKALQAGNGIATVGLHLVGYHDVAGIHAVNSHVDDGAHGILAFHALGDLGTGSLHQLDVAHADRVTIDGGADALASYLLNIVQSATIGEQLANVGRAAIAQCGILERGVAESRAKGGGYGVSAVFLGMSREM